MRNRFIDQKRTKQVVMDIGYWEKLKLKATEDHTSIKAFLEDILGEVFEVKNDK